MSSFAQPLGPLNKTVTSTHTRTKRRFKTTTITPATSPICLTNKLPLAPSPFSPLKRRREFCISPHFCLDAPFYLKNRLKKIETMFLPTVNFLINCLNLLNKRPHRFLFEGERMREKEREKREKERES